MSRTLVFKDFVDRIGAPDKDECWPWLGPNSNYRYGWFGKRLAHRAAHEYFIGPIPDGMDVMHSCDFGLCVNPEHLSYGTRADNLRDMAAKNRGTIKLSVEDVHEIRRLRSEGRKIVAIAEIYGIAHNYVSYICNGKSRRHV